MLLEKINNPQDLKKVKIEQLPELASEIRRRIIDIISVTGGHLASSLGAVELSIALHYCLDAPRDKIIWDVGHQTYAHKILTGRNKDFDSIRQYKGISGFPSKEESPYDTFTTGHSSTAVSLALGLACAREYLPKEQYFKVAAIIGDGSVSGGLCFEGLNNAGHLKKDIMVILNTNELSIAPNAGALSIYLNKIISMPVYNRFRSSLETFVKSRVPKGSRLIQIANKFEEGLKGMFVPGMLFEELGFRYFGPFDGHNLNLLITTIKNISSIKGPVLLHVVTKKGKGYAPAESNPVKFHSAAPFDIKTGKSIAKETEGQLTYTEVFRDSIAELATNDSKVVAITAAMPEGAGLDKFRDMYPGRFFDVGIAEGHAVSFASGLAKSGLKPIVAIYSTFLQRAYDQIVECVALQNLNVVFAIDRAGVVGGDGPTHQGIFDIAYLRNIPNMIIMAPKDGEELKRMLEFAVHADNPVAIRYPKDTIPVAYANTREIKLGKSEVVRETGDDFAILALGSMVIPACEAMEILKADGLSGIVINARFVKPLDTCALGKIAKKIKNIFTVEDGIRRCGFGSAVTECVGRPVIRIGLPDEFIPCGKRELLLDKYGLTKEGIAQKIKEAIEKNA
jgi:1-deoxy-D-xylulose-5-phosphate synthase